MKNGLKCASSFLISLTLALTVALPTSAPTSAQESANVDPGIISITLGPNDSLRSISQQYLGSPDLWPIILRLNGYRQITELDQNTELMIPVSQAQISVEALESALGEIQRATEKGAQIFAPKLIKNAIDFRSKALTSYKDGVYNDSIDYSNQSINNAEVAVKQSEDNRDEKAEALLNDKQGRVEGQKPEENSWADRQLYSILTELEKIRTLSDSTAQIIFRDASRIRLNANSQAVIQRLRADPLKRTEEAEINVISGDFYADLAKESQRSNFKVNLRDVGATIESGQFWLSQTEGSSKFTNYDVKPVSISNNGETLTLGRNEGVIIDDGKATTDQDKVAVIARTTLLAPKDDTTLFNNTVSLSWAKVDKASAYWLEVAFDQNFDQMRENLWGLPSSEGNQVELAPGQYFWRVSALDKNGLPGPRSIPQKFSVRSDVAPPFLALRTPLNEAFFREQKTLISGESEPDTAILINGVQVETDNVGRFSYILEALEGINRVQVVARDQAGNETSKSVQFIYLKDGHKDIVYEAEIPRDKDGVFLTASDSLTLSGLAEPAAELVVVGPDNQVLSSTFTNENGVFGLNVPIQNANKQLEVRVKTKSGYSYNDMIAVRKSSQPPIFEIETPLPRITDAQMLEFKARVEPGSVVTMNDQRAEVDGNTALFSVLLEEGTNRLNFVITNRVGLVTAAQSLIIFDKQAPEIVEKSLNTEQNGDYTSFQFKIRARDASGLAKTAKVIIQIGDKEIEGALRFNRARKQYSGTVDAQVNGVDVSNIIVKLEDVAGNLTDVSMVQ